MLPEELENITMKEIAFQTLPLEVNCTDLGAASLLAQYYGRWFKYCQVPNRSWYLYDGHRWKKDVTSEIYTYLDLLIKLLYTQSGEEGGTGRKNKATWAIKLESMARQRQVIAKATTLQNLNISSENFDKNNYLFNTLNCTLDLSSGEPEFRAPCREDYITKIAPVYYESKARCPNWINFLNDIFHGNEEVIPFLQRAVGYSLTGNVSEQCLFFAYGSGKNGKTVFFETVKMLFGEYAGKAPVEMVLQQKQNSIPSDIALLKGIRFAVCSEIEENRRLAEAKIKDLSGGDTIVARELYRDWFSFKPTHKLWMYGNHKPLVYGDDIGIWRRLKIIPFTVKIPDEKEIPMNQLLSSFKKEMSGILNWALQGYVEYREGGLPEPDSVRLAIGSYRSEMDIVGDFLNECCAVNANESIIAKHLWEHYHGWCDGVGERALAGRRLNTKLRERGFTIKPGAGNRLIIYGLKLMNENIQEEVRFNN